MQRLLQKPKTICFFNLVNITYQDVGTLGKPKGTSMVVWFFLKMGVCFTKMGVWLSKMGVCFFENGSLAFENESLFFWKWEFVFRKWEFVFLKNGSLVFENGNLFLMIQMVDRSNTTPIGQDSTSQWRNVLFSLLTLYKLHYNYKILTLQLTILESICTLLNSEFTIVTYKMSLTIRYISYLH